MVQLSNAVERYNKLILQELKDNSIYCWLAGGALRDYFAGLRVNTDYDLFFPNEIEYEKAKTYFKSKECAVKWESDNGMKIVYNGKTFDLIKKFFNSPKETIDAFDFTVSMFAVDTEKVYYGETAFIDLAKRQLMVNKITYPASSFSRMVRYINKGFSICLGEQKKLIMAIQDMPKEVNSTSDNNQSNDSSESTSLDEENSLFFRGID